MEYRKAINSLSWEAKVNACIAELSKALITDKSTEDISCLILEFARSLTESKYGYMGYIDPDTGYLISCTLTKDVRDECKMHGKEIVFKKFTGLWGWVLKHKEPLMTNTPLKDTRYSGLPKGHIPIERFLSVPALIGNDLVGQISIANSVRDYTERELELLNRLSSLYAIALQRKRIDDALRESEGQYRILFNSVKDGVFVTKVEDDGRWGVFLEANDMICQILGYSKEELLTLSPYDITGPEYLDQMPQLMEKVQHKKTILFETSILTKDGRNVPIEVRSHLFNFKGNIATLDIVRDISERKKSEEELKRAYGEFQQIFNTGADGMRVIDKDFNIIRVNERFLRLIGYPKGEIIGRKCYDIFPCKLCFKPNCILNQVLNTKQPVEHEIEKERMDGSKVSCLVMATPFWSTWGEIVGVVESYKDITDLKHIEAELRHSKEIAEAASKAKSTFLASVSHELRTPLNSIIGFSELLQEQYLGPLTEKQNKYINNILESGRHLLSLINDILDISKIEADKMDLQVSEFSIKELLIRSLELISAKAYRHSITISHFMDERIPNAIKADERKIKQVIFNLLSNAAKFTQDRGNIHIEARLVKGSDIPVKVFKGRTEEEFLLISVQDTGIGIAKKDIKNIFEAFYQINKRYSRKISGSGLGLSLSRSLINLHGGQIWAESEGEGKGSKFSFILPFAFKAEIFKGAH